jgi:hypothetical protein
MERTDNGEPFQEPRLVLYSESSDNINVPSPSEAAATARRRRLHGHHPLLVAPSAPLGTPIDPPANAQVTVHPLLYGHGVPMDIVVRERGASSLCSIVSEITQPLELSTQKHISNGDIAEMKRRLEAIKERRARIKGRQRQEIPTFIVSNQKNRRSRNSDTGVETPNPSSDRIAVFVEAANHNGTDQDTVSFVPAEKWPTTFSATLPSTPPRRKRIVNRPQELLRLPGVSISPKSTGVSTCQTFDETVLSYNDTNGRTNNNGPWDVRRLLCISTQPVTSTVDTGFGQIRSSGSMDICADRRQQLALEENNWHKKDNELRQYSPLARTSSICPRNAIPTLTEETEVDADRIHQEDTLIDLESLPNYSLSSTYPHPTIPGKAYSEIVSDSSQLDSDLTFAPRSQFSSCLRRDPWYMTRRMKAEKDAECAKLLEGNHTMHAVVFMKQNWDEGVYR